MAVVTHKHVFCHMPKTGGDFITSYLRAEHEGKDPPLIHGHAPYSYIPKKWLKGRKPFGSIRDPWSWYASWWMHAKSARLEKDGLLRYGAGSEAFRAVLAGVLSCNEQTTPKNAGLIWSHDTDAGRAAYLAMKNGLYTWVFGHIFGGMVKTFVDLPQVYQGIEEVLGIAVDTGRYPPRNTRHAREGSAVDDPRTLYDDKMIRAVWEADGALIKRLGYTEPFGRAPAPVIHL